MVDRRSAATPALGGLALALHLWANGSYDFFRDELYFVVCGQHPAWGYVDQPPLTPLIAAAERLAFGPSVLALRLVPALGAAALVGLTCQAARLLGGGRFAAWLAGLAVLAAPGLEIDGVLLTTDSLQPLAWLGLTLLLRAQLERERPWRWLAFGLLLGLTLLDKYLVVFWGAAVAAGLLATGGRRLLARAGAWLALVLALAVAAPNLWWQVSHGLPFLELGRAAVAGKNVAYSPAGYLVELVESLNPATLPVWLAGLWAAAREPRLGSLRFLAPAVVLLIALFIATHGKPYYAVPAFPMLFAAGAVALERRLVWAWPRAALAGLVVAGGLVLLPFGLPILPVGDFLAWQAALGVAPKTDEHLRLGALPQVWADMFGWRAMAEAVGQAYQALPPEDRARAVFLGGNYGEAAAIDLFGGPWDLPPAISGHNNYFLWGPRGHDGSVVLRVGGARERLLESYRSVEQVGWLGDPHAMPYETDRPVWLCRDRKPALTEDWAAFKIYQ